MCSSIHKNAHAGYSGKEGVVVRALSGFPGFPGQLFYFSGCTPAIAGVSLPLEYAEEDVK
ncbi:MAG: hypothetical protein ACOX1I_03185 [Dethiobacteria bacterium]|jgi:hypothetical protein